MAQKHSIENTTFVSLIYTQLLLHRIPILFIIILILLALRNLHLKRRRLINTHVRITHQKQGQLMLPRRRHHHLQPRLQRLRYRDPLDREQRLCLLLPNHEPPVLRLLRWVERSVNVEIRLFVFVYVALDGDDDVAWCACCYVLGVLDLEAKF